MFEGREEDRSRVSASLSVSWMFEPLLLNTTHGKSSYKIK